MGELFRHQHRAGDLLRAEHSSTGLFFVQELVNQSACSNRPYRHERHYDVFRWQGVVIANFQAVSAGGTHPNVPLSWGHRSEAAAD